MTTPCFFSKHAAMLGRVTGAALLLGGIIAFPGARAQAGTCLEAVDQLAEANALNVDPPNATPPGAHQGTPPQDGTAPLAAKDLAILESILVAARGEAKRGNEADCFKRVQKAQDFLAEKGR